MKKELTKMLMDNWDDGVDAAIEILIEIFGQVIPKETILTPEHIIEMLEGSRESIKKINKKSASKGEV